MFNRSLYFLDQFSFLVIYLSGIEPSSHQTLWCTMLMLKSYQFVFLSLLHSVTRMLDVKKMDLSNVNNCFLVQSNIK